MLETRYFNLLKIIKSLEKSHYSEIILTVKVTDLTANSLYKMKA